jgi:hypothetical protein
MPSESKDAGAAELAARRLAPLRVLLYSDVAATPGCECKACDFLRHLATKPGLERLGDGDAEPVFMTMRLAPEGSRIRALQDLLAKLT